VTVKVEYFVVLLEY